MKTYEIMMFADDLSTSGTAFVQGANAIDAFENAVETGKLPSPPRAAGSSASVVIANAQTGLSIKIETASV